MDSKIDELKSPSVENIHKIPWYLGGALKWRKQSNKRNMYSISTKDSRLKKTESSLRDVELFHGR